MADSGQQPEKENDADQPQIVSEGWPTTALGIVGILLVTAIALAGRLLQLDRYPGGLHPAEAEHALLARQSVDASLQWLIDGAQELSTTLAAAIALVGWITQFDATAPRVAAAICGAGSVLFTGLWLRREVGAICAVTGAAVVAGSFWHILFSRLALAPIAGAMALAAMLWFISEAISRRGPNAAPWYGLTGVAAGLAFLSTPSLRLLPVALLVILALAVYRSWAASDDVPDTLGWALAATVALVVIAPFLISHYDNLRAFTSWEPTLGLPGNETANLLTVPSALISTFAGLFLSDDAERGLNLPTNAYISLLLIPWAIFGLLGLFSASNDPQNRDRFVAGGVLVLALAVGVSAVDAGHPGQLVVLSPLVAGLIVYGFRTVIYWTRIRTVRFALGLLIVTGVLGDAAWSASRYLDGWAREPETQQVFHSGTVAALIEIDRLDDPGPMFISMHGRDDLLAYFVTPARRHTFDGARSLPFPVDEDGYLLIPAERPLEPILDGLLDHLPELNSARDGSGYRLFRLDARLREQMPLSAPTVLYDYGIDFHGNRLFVGSERDVATVLIAWRTPAGNPAYDVDVRLSPVDVTADATEVTVELPENPVDSRLFQVLAVPVEIPPAGTDYDLEVRLRDTDGDILATAGLTEDGYLLLNRYRIEE